MEASRRGIGDLIYQQSFAMPGSSSGRYAARLYRPIIFTLTTVIISLTAIAYARMGRWIGPVLSLGAVGYALLFIFRMRMPSALEQRYYGAGSQFVRGILSLLGVVTMSAVLFAYEVVDHELWLLYVLSTLIISEHNSSRAVRVVLFLVAASILAIPFFVLVLWSHWSVAQYVNGLLLRLMIQLAGILLITFVSHYLIRNIQGRQLAVSEHRRWAEGVARLTQALENPEDQLREVISLVEGLTEARARLWLVRLTDGGLTDGSSDQPNPAVARAAVDGQPHVALPARPLQTKQPSLSIVRRAIFKAYHLLIQETTFALPIEPDANLPEGISAQVIIPITTPHGDLIAVLEVAYGLPAPDELTLNRHCLRLTDFVGYAQLIIANATHVARMRQEERLSDALNALANTTQIANQVVSDLVEITGFDSAAVWLVDHDTRVLRCMAQVEAPWCFAVNLPLHAPKLSIAATAVRVGYTICQCAASEEGMSRRTRQRYRLGDRRRMFVPIPSDLSQNGPLSSVGVLEVGFRPGRKPHIAPELTRILETYALKVGLALATAESLAAERQFIQSLSALLDSSRQFMSRSSYYTSRDMATLVGQAASHFLGVDIVMVYSFDEESQDLELVYAGPRETPILGHKPLTVTLDNNILSLLHREHTSYFASDARHDPNLVGSMTDASVAYYRSFTQRQNIKSFAGLRLSGINGGIHGFLCLNFRTRHEFSDRERKLLELFALLAGAALDEVHNHRQARDLLMTRERAALATELHHHMSQTLWGLQYYALTTAHYACHHNEDSKLNENAVQAAMLATRGRKALGEMLKYLHELPDSFGGFDQEVTALIEAHRRLEPTIQIGLTTEIIGAVPRQVEFYLFRIAAEAIANAVRHASAACITANYRVSSTGEVKLTIDDDGMGLPDTFPPFGHGQEAMKYFADKIHASLVVAHNEVGGVRVSVHFQPFGR